MSYEALKCVTAQTLHTQTSKRLSHAHLYYCLSVYLCLFTETEPQCDLFTSVLRSIHSEDILCGCGAAERHISSGKTEKLYIFRH